MSVHLNECICYVESCCPWMGECNCQCICDTLRACEDRVREDEQSHNFSPDIHWDGMAEAYQRGLDAAREAVKHLQHSDDCYYAQGVLCHCEIKRAITAIDALRKEV